MKLPATLLLASAALVSVALACPQEPRDTATTSTPQGVHGVWDLKARRGDRTMDYTLELIQDGNALAGTVTGPGGEKLGISSATFRENVLKFSVPTGGGAIQVEGRIECDRLAGTYTEGGGVKDTWEAKRRPGATAGPAGNPFTTAADAEIGRKYFLGHCAYCHGPEGEGGRGANLTTGQYRHGGSDRDLFRTIKNGITGSEMPASELSEKEVWRIIAHVRKLAAAGAEEKAPGDVQSGRIVYQSKGACAQCHTIDRQGGVLGPDLSDIGLRRSLKFLRQALVEPDAYVADNYRTFTVTTLKGEQITGVRLNEDEHSIQLRDSREQLRSFLKRNLKESKRETRSLMPSYGATLTTVEIENLLAYLSSLRSKP